MLARLVCSPGFHSQYPPTHTHKVFDNPQYCKQNKKREKAFLRLNSCLKVQTWLDDWRAGHAFVSPVA